MIFTSLTKGKTMGMGAEYADFIIESAESAACIDEDLTRTLAHLDCTRAEFVEDAVSQFRQWLDARAWPRS